MPDPVIDVRDLVFSWRSDLPPVLSLDELAIDGGEKVFIKGPSGCGKSTLLSVLGGVAVAQQGEAVVLSSPLRRLKQSERDRFRADHIGFVFQMFNLIPYLSVVENVTLPCRFSPKRRQQAQSRGRVELEASRLLAHLGLGDQHLLDKPPTDLSVGQQQRVAVARALLGGPEIIVADEPTSALDTELRDTFIGLLMEECAQTGATLLFVSHDGGLAHFFDRVIDLQAINRVQ